MNTDDIAIIGMAGVFPEAADLTAFYKNLCEGRDSVRDIPEERKIFSRLPDDNYQVNGVLDRIDLFDHNFFMIPKIEADFMDPHQRISLQLACTAIENAGYALSHFAKTNTGVCVATSNPGYRNFFNDMESIKSTGVHPANIVGRISHDLDLWGPGLVIDTSCSSSLVAVIHACNELKCGNADYMLAGGINLYFDFFRKSENQMGINSSDGKCRTFSSNAKGTGWGEGGGMLLLKRYSDAIADNDYVHAVIRGYAYNQNGKRTIAVSSPSSEAQTDVFIKAMQKATIDPAKLGYIEAHGTATPLGDPIEVQGLINAMASFTDARNFCALGSVKTNIGHLNVAAGIAGLIKAALSVKYKKKFPSLHFTAPNPHIDFDNSPFFVNTTLTEWQDTERLAAVNSLGINGSNAHMVLASSLPSIPVNRPAEDKELLLKVSAKSKNSLVRNIKQIFNYIRTSTEHPEDITYTLNNGRDDYKYRLMVTGNSLHELAEKLNEVGSGAKDCYQPERVFNLLLSPDIQVDTEQVRLFAEKYVVFREKYDLCIQCSSADIPERPLQIFAYQFAFYHLLLSKGVTINEVFATGFCALVANVVTGEITLDSAIKRIPGRVQSTSPLNYEGFAAYIQDAAGKSPILFLETGPGGILGASVQQLIDTSVDAVLFVLQPGAGDPLLKIVAGIYNSGVNINWNKWYGSENLRRVETPTYCFDEVSCWETDSETVHVRSKIQPVHASGSARQINDIPDSIYTWKWVEQDVRGQKKYPSNTIFLFLMDEAGLGAELIRSLQTNNNTCLKVVYGTRFAELNNNEFEIDPLQEKHYTSLCSLLLERGIIPGGIFYLPDYAVGEKPAPDTLAHTISTGVCAQLLLYRAFVQVFSPYMNNKEFRIVYVSAGAHSVKGEIAAADKHMSVALYKTLLSSYPSVKINCIDTEYIKDDCSGIAQQVLKEMTHDEMCCFTAYRNGKRYVQEIERIYKSETDPENSLYQQGGVYLITGGAGGIGLNLCKHIASKVKCSFLIVGRTPHDAAIKNITDELAAIGNMGCTVEYFNGDVGDIQFMKSLQSEIKLKYPSVDMILHCAGTPGEALPIERQALPAFKQTIMPKAMGSVLLKELADEVRPRYFILFSSFNTILPGKNTFGYTAANAFLDAYAGSLSSTGVKTIAINWDAWVETGMGVRNGKEEVQNSDLSGLKTDEGIQAFELCLKAGYANVIVTKAGGMLHNLPFFRLAESSNNSPEQLISPATDSKSIVAKLSTIIGYFVKSDSVKPDDDFFELGMHSLMGMHVTNKIKEVFELEIDFDDLFTYSTIHQLTGFIKEQLEASQDSVLHKEVAVYKEIPALPPQEHYALSSAQERLWILQHYSKDQTNYNLGSLFMLGDDLDLRAFEQAFDALIDRHEVLRTIFMVVNEEPRQKILHRSAGSFGIEYVELDQNEDISFQIKQRISGETKHIFDLSSAPLFRARLLRTGEKNIAFLLTLHHIIFDGWSAEILTKEFQTLYEAFAKAQKSPLAPLGIQYKDYAAWLNSQMATAEFERHKAYWLEQLSGELPVLRLSTDHPRPAVKTYNAGVLKFLLPADVKQKLISLGKDEGNSLFMILVALVNTLLYRFSGQQDIIVGTTVANRNHPQLENQIGFYVNMLPLRTKFHENDTFSALLGRMRQSVLQAYEHQAYPFDLLVKEINSDRDIARSPLFDVLVELGIDMTSSGEKELLARKDEHSQIASTPYDLSFRFLDAANGIVALLEYNTDLFTESSITALKIRFCAIIESVINDPQIMLNATGLNDEQDEEFTRNEKMKEMFNIPDLF